ncbi:MAG TPA: FAD-binding oxidoreductase [Pyrinomonadaceae bacterium]|nr:FAD-binding oxidoreductase [Pyrinomonadaceae bacterium]
MLTKSDPDEIQTYLSDSSYLPAGKADRVVFPETAEDVAEILRAATREKLPVTISGAGTGTVGGRVPTAGIVLATDKLNQIRSIAHNKDGGGSVVAGAGVRLVDLQKFVDSEQLFYPPDPTERSCFLGGTVATNASGARTFKYGPTRKYIQRLKLVLATGDIINLRRGELRASPSGEIKIPLPTGRTIAALLPAYQMPHTRKHAAGYYIAPEMDLVDLFIGSEGTLGVVVEIEVALLPKPEALLSGVVFFSNEEDLLAFVQSARNRSLTNRKLPGSATQLAALMDKALEVTDRQARPQLTGPEDASTNLDARALEYFDSESLNFLRQKYEAIPADAVGAIFFEQETTSATDESLMSEWLGLLEQHNALADKSWFATGEADQAGLREFRHALPVLMNEWFARHNQRKVSTDMSVPDSAFSGMLRFYQETLNPSGLRYTIFGHIGDNHVHVNILPRNDDEAIQAREIYLQFLKRAAAVGGTLSAEHGIGKLKRDYLRLFYSEQNLREMAALKLTFDPAGILGRGNIFSEEYL